MTMTTSVHSNAFNFMSFLHNGVDPRTGQYTMSITLPEVKTNDLRGPGVPLTLAYNPLNSTDSGFGLGWSLHLSQYSKANNVVTLSSGESFKVTSTAADDRLLMKEQKIESFRLYKAGATGYRVVHKSGLVEHLQEQGSASHRYALPVSIQAPEGHRVHLDYLTFDGWPLLSTVKDDAGHVLLRIEREQNTEVRILFQPDAGPGGEPLARFVMTLQGEERRIILPTDNQASWRYRYDTVGQGYLRITSVQTPTGATEHLFYADAGHQFPNGSGQKPLPRVTRHLIEPGCDQPALDTHYSYQVGHGEHNFLGAGLNIGWDSDGLDNLYKHIGPYVYGSVESLYVDGQEARRIERTFNQFHLLTQEVTAQGKTRRTVETHYPMQDGKPFEQQASQCQLPIEVTTRWTLQGEATRIRSETVTTRYDAHGNLLSERQPTGVEQVNTWYPADGAEDGCPADPYGFVRQLKTQTVNPAAGEGAARPVSTRYRYTALPALTDSGLPDWPSVESEVLVQHVEPAPRELQRTVYAYHDTPTDSLLHGQLQRQTVSLGRQDTVTQYAYSRHDSPVFGESVLRTVQTLTGFDGQTKVITLEHSLLNGEPLLNRDDNDVEIRYEYDVLRRVTRETVAPGTAFEASRRYTYRLCATPQDQAEQSLFDVKQVKTLSRFDGLNRVIYEERDDADTPGRASEPRPIYRAFYDAWGRLVEEIEYDWLGDQPLSLARRLAYDEWGEQSCETGPDGVSIHQQTDPIGTLDSQGPVQTHWREAASGERSALTCTWLNLFEKPTRVERFDTAGASLSLAETTYDGLGRTLQERQVVDAALRTTGYLYDGFDRITTTQLADDTWVQRAYASHSREDLPILIRVLPGANQEGVLKNGRQKVLGQQVFDGLDRRIEAITGGRKQVFTYAPGQRQPESVTTASGQKINYRYQPQLSEEPLERHLPGQVMADYTYDPHNALLLDCHEQDDHLRREYFSTGDLKKEIRRFADGPEYTMHYRYSRLGRSLSYTDVLGQEQTCTYDAQGRLASTALNSLGSVFTYDALGRTASILTTDSASGQHLGVTLAYDDLDREILRVFDLDGVEQRLEQRWNEDDELVRRTLCQAGQILRDEHYRYDVRGRLSEYECTGSQAPVDPYGKTIEHQVFVFDELDNFKAVRTWFAGGSNMALYFYDGPDPAQLTRIVNDHVDYPATIELVYDLDGNLVQDEAGRTLHYDALNRLIEVSRPGTDPGRYRYDPLDTLSTRQEGDAPEQRFYRDGELATRLAGNRHSVYLRGGDRVLAEQTITDTRMLAGDINNSVLNQVGNGAVTPRRYTAYGHHDGSAATGEVGYNGELSEPDTGWQLLGNGYRAYNPVLMRFHSFDSLSPFGEGGVNGYAYCEGDPVNRVDPSGHSPWGGLIRLFRQVKTTASSMAEKVPVGLKLTKGTKPQRFSKVTPKDVRVAREVAAFAIKKHKTAHDEIMGATGNLFQLNRLEGAANAQKITAMETLEYLENTLGKQGITRVSRKHMTTQLARLRQAHAQAAQELNAQVRLTYQQRNATRTGIAVGFS